CQPRTAVLGPGDQPDATGPEYGRIEAVLQQPQRLAGSPSWQLQLQQAHNEHIIYSSYPFRYQPADEPRLQQLRTQYHLDDVVAGAADEFEALVRLRNWTRSQFRRCDYQPWTKNFDALEVLNRNLRNPTQQPYVREKHLDPCQFFPLLYCQVLLSMGYQSRLVSIGHGMVEVWSNQYQKWVTMDAELNFHYVRHG